MKRWTILLVSMMACSDVQVGNTPTEPEVTAESVAALTGRGESPTPEMLAAALTGDPDQMAAAIGTAAACQAPFTCDPNLFSCGTWSSFVTCGGQYCSSVGCVRPPKCNPNTNPNCEVFGRFAQNSQSFSVCWNSDRTQSCTSWRISAALGTCGC